MENIRLKQLDKSNQNCELLASYYRLLDSSFEPSLSSYVDINAYAKKLIENAYVATLEYDDQFVGLMAVYINDTKNKIAYMSSLAVLDEYKGKEFSKILMNYVIKVAREAGMKTIKFEVKKDYQRAIIFYEKMGNKQSDECTSNESTIFMYQNL